jgi:hypothetical protein
MPTVDFTGVADANEFTPVPEGTYTVEVDQVDEEVSQKGDELLKVRLHVIEGEHAGALVFDRLYFSQRALPRVKLVLDAMGLSTSGEVDVTPGLLLGRKCRVDVTVDTYIKRDGSEGKATSIPYAGYHRLGGEDDAEDADESIAPF